MLFFKFHKPSNLEFNMLRRGEIFFASVAELNDANECRPRFVLNGTRELWTRLARYILQEAYLRSEVYDRASREEMPELFSLSESLGTQLKKRACNRDFGLEKLDALFRELLEQELKNNTFPLQSRLILDSIRRVIRYDLPKAIEEQSYIASFSRSAKNPTMWGHYADAERGFVIVYTTGDGTLRIASPIKMLHGTRPLPEDRLGHFEIGFYDEDCLELKAVKYGKKPPKVNAFHRLIPRFSYSEEEDHYDVPLLLGGDAKDKEEDQVGLVKFSDWRYEQEVRAFLPVFKELPPDMRVMRVAQENICGLIFGQRLSERDKRRAVLCCHLMRESSGQPEPAQPFMFFQAFQVIDRFDFKIVPVGILDGLYFDRHLPIKTIDDLDETTRQSLREVSDQIENGLQDIPTETKSPTPK
ncbi:MAG: DUF2971 domain-containing protein [Betaproteobacteria bacterium]|nr:DUF2971 domain-containing protein [Betaproteobacteria bacterium]